MLTPVALEGVETVYDVADDRTGHTRSVIAPPRRRILNSHHDRIFRIVGRKIGCHTAQVLSGRMHVHCRTGLGRNTEQGRIANKIFPCRTRSRNLLQTLLDLPQRRCRTDLLVQHPRLETIYGRTVAADLLDQHRRNHPPAVGNRIVKRSRLYGRQLVLVSVGYLAQTVVVEPTVAHLAVFRIVVVEQRLLLPERLETHRPVEVQRPQKGYIPLRMILVRAVNRIGKEDI